MKTSRLVPAIILDALAIVLAILGYNDYYKATVLNDYLDTPFFGDLNASAQKSHELYYKLEFGGAAVAFIIAAVLIVKGVKEKKAENQQKNEWKDIR
ncbi:MAG: hypothetical protein MI810_13305 [Flavobacteriales bacterium]|nr:hypothetical protein [Flavobacteriales bacterium]